VRCSKCGAENPDRAKFCVECAAAFVRRCPSCGAENPPTAKFCLECAQPLSGASPARDVRPQPAGESPAGLSRRAPSPIASGAGDAQTDGERKTVTALFADIKGSTELEQDLDPEEARAIVDPALKLMIDAVGRYDGYIVQSTGDGIFALFGAPVAHEDHPQRALYAALRMQEDLRRYSTKLVADGGNPLQCRVGVNTGEVVVRTIATGGGHVEYTPIGHTTNLASRMQAVAPVGSTAVAEPTRKLCEGYFTLKALGPTRVRGVNEAVNVYEVTGLGPLRTRLQRSAGRGLTKFVGREREMDAMRNASQLARAGRGQIIAAMAEAGTGKSRLFFEFKAKNQSGWNVLETFSVSHGKASAYFPVIDLLHTYFKIAGEDDQRARRVKVNGTVLTLDRSLEDTLPYLFALLGIVDGDDPLAEMDAQVRKRRTLDAIKRILLRESLNQPLMVIFEDLHWIDGETQALLNLLADSIANAKVLLLVNYRPEYSHQWNSKTYYTQLRLDPLGKESADEMLSALLGDHAAIAPLKRLIIERTEGNPFFMEETVQVLLDEGALVREGSSTRLTRPLGELKIPPTVQAILAARIDRLPADEKDVLQTLAVIGKEFPLSLVRATTSLARLLDQQGKRDEARAMLTEIYNWFTEGFDTADLKDAKALLDELSQ
jgi:class 3 adenylate cyclase/ribosomal protein L40E